MPQKSSFETDTLPFSAFTSPTDFSTSICCALPCGRRAEPYGTAGWSVAIPFWYQYATEEMRSARSPKAVFTRPSGR